MKKILTLLLILSIAACSSTPQPPVWLSQPTKVYPENQYLSAVGQGQDPEQAKQIALAKLIMK